MKFQTETINDAISYTGELVASDGRVFVVQSWSPNVSDGDGISIKVNMWPKMHWSEEADGRVVKRQVTDGD